LALPGFAATIAAMQRILPVVLILLAALAGCASTVSSNNTTCRDMVDAASADLDRAKAKGFGDFVDVVKASALIVSASAQRSAEKYQGCIEHAQRARDLLRPLL
jgi:uncharacterized protein YceK